MICARLLSNTSYHVTLTPSGGGYSRWRTLAVSRWREDAALEDDGFRLFLHEESTGSTWVPVALPPPRDRRREPDLFAAVSPAFANHVRGIETVLSVTVAAGADVELRRLRIFNRSAHPRTLAATSLVEIALAPSAVDGAHLAFSKLFVETRIDPELPAIFASRRPSKPDDVQAWLFHRAVVHDVAAELSFDTDRAHFIGRGYGSAEPRSVVEGDALTGVAGPVLDAAAIIRADFTLEVGSACTIDWFLGVGESPQACEALARQVSAAGFGDDVVRRAPRATAMLHEHIGISAAVATQCERLAGGLLFATAGLRAPAAEIAGNRLGQAGLWAFGISGDVPIVVLEFVGETQVALLNDLLCAQAFWKAHGLSSELMIIVGDPASASAARLLDLVRSVVGASVVAGSLDKPAGVFVRDSSLLAAHDRTLIRSAARIVVEREVTSLAQLLQQAGSEAATRVAARNTGSQAAAAPGPHDMSEIVAPPDGLVAFNGHGGFSPDLSEYVIVSSAGAMTPAPWSNIIANPEFGTLVTESGSASTWSENSHEFRLTPWSNDPTSDPSSEALYLRDEDSGQVWSPTLLPVRSAGAYVTRHGFGYSRFEHNEGGVESSLVVHVAIDAPVKFSVLTLRNRSLRRRRLSVTGYVEWVLGDARSKNAMHVVVERDERSGALFATNGYNTDFAGRTAFFFAEHAESTACADRASFFGAGGSRAAPAALAAAALSERLGAALDPCASLRVAVDLAPGEEQEVIFLLGAGKSTEDARALVERWRGADAAGAALEAARGYWVATLSTVQVRTPAPSVDALANGWLLYQVIGSRLWGRTAFYQSSGAYGFRDQLQDVMALLHCQPTLVREHLVRAAARQFPEGDVQHWWHPPLGKGIRTRCSDDYLWLPFVTARYVRVTGDASVLDERCAFLDAPLLEAGEASSYGVPKVGGASASLYEHCVRALRHGMRYGEHGLPLMGGGDWNDGMDQVGAGGRGESVWVAFFFLAVLKRFIPVSLSRNDAAFAERCETEAATLAANVDAHAWDGAWYLRAFFDDGAPLGSARNKECQIDSIAQSWSVLAGGTAPDRARRAMDAVHDRLVRRDTRLIQLLDPPFNASAPSPGYIQGYVPGVRENGGQYTHGAVWAALAFAELGDAERAWEAFALLEPVSHGDSAAAIAKYKVEPYVTAGDVYSSLPHAGRGGWTWYSGSAGWLYQLLVDSLLGFERRGSRLRLRPLLPRAWPGFTILYRFGSATYEIACRASDSARSAGTTVDGVPVPEGWIELVDDRAAHTVVVQVARNDAPRAADHEH
jgi:cyclic beta-1,2-glucan synthetase